MYIYKYSMYNIYRNLCAKLSDSSSYKSLYLCVHIEGLISIDSATDPDQQYTYIRVYIYALCRFCHASFGLYILLLILVYFN